MKDNVLFRELTKEESISIYAGDWVKDFGYNCKVAYNKVCNWLDDLFSSDDKD